MGILAVEELVQALGYSIPSAPLALLTVILHMQVASMSVFRDVEDNESCSSHFSSLSLRPGMGLSHAHSLRRNSSATSWNSDCSDG